MNKRMQSITQMVWHCLESYPETRSSDRELILQIYSEFYGVFNQPFFKVLDRNDLPSFESIRRARQKLQSEWEYLRADDPVEDARIAKQEEFLEYAKEDLRI